MRQHESQANAVRGFITVGTVFSFFYCMLVSGALLSTPILGGKLYLACQAVIQFVALWRPSQDGIISKTARRVGAVLLILALGLVFALTVLFPIEFKNADFGRLAGIAACMALRPVLTEFIVERAQTANKKTTPPLLLVCFVQLLFLAVALLLLPLRSLTPGTTWALIGGFLVSGILEAFSTDWTRGRTRPFSEQDKEVLMALRGAHSFRMYQDVLLIATIALQVTLIMSCTYIALSAEALLPSMAVALLCVFAAYALADTALRRGLIPHPNPHMLLMAGLFLWLCGLILFLCTLSAPTSVTSYVSLALCSVGAAVCARTLTGLKDDMRRVAAFVADGQPGDAMDRALDIRIRFASLLGKLAALAGLALIGKGFCSYHFFLTVPALLLVACGIVSAIRFPLSHLDLDKLRKYAALRQEGRENGPLRDQLEAVVVKKSIKCYGIRAIIYILWIFCYHKVRGTEKIHLDEDTPCVFVCNHGEIYGPIVATLYVPYPFRPWVTYEMTDVNVIVDRTMNGTFQDVKGVSRKVLNWAMGKFGAPFLAWIMRSVNCIPVYHDNPRKLMQTFRATTTAMEAGDNILLFPENSDTSPDHRYVREGVSEFFTGFTMIGQLYANKTGKCPLFIPLYADKKKRVITFGEPTRYNADLPASEEKERLCKYLRDEMLKIAGLKDS